MKKVISLIISIFILVSLFSGCNEAEPTSEGTSKASLENTSSTDISSEVSDTDSEEPVSGSSEADTSNGSGDPSESTSSAAPAVPTSPPQNDNMIEVGVSMTDITPKENVQLMGGVSAKASEGVDTNLYIKAVVISDEKTTFVVITFDNLKFMSSDMTIKKIARETGIPEKNIIITTSHTHSAPFYTYYPELRTIMTDTVKSAMDDMEPCRLLTAETQVENISRNRRLLKDGYCYPAWTISGNYSDYEPAGTADPGVGILAAVDKDGKYKTILWNFACHPAANLENKISADYPGHVQNQLNQSLGYEIPALYIPGASGDVNSINHNLPVIGKRFADGILSSLANGSWVDGIEVKSLSADIKVKSRQDPVFQEEDVSTVWPDQVEGYRQGFNNYLARVKDEYTLPIRSFCIGDDFALVSIPGELFNSLGNDIIAGSSFSSTMVAEQSNGAFGYLPTVRDFDLGGYETWFAEHSYLEINAGQMLRDKALSLLESLAG